MQLAIVDFSKQNLVSPEDVKVAVQRLPKEHYDRIQSIWYDPDRSLAYEMAYMNNNPESLKARGTYLHDWSSSASVVVIYPFRTREEFFHTLYHEIGHHVFLRVLDQNLRNEWFALRNAEKKFVSARARKNSKEDFSETYSCCCFRVHLQYRTPEKTDFMLKRVFQGLIGKR